MAARGCSRPASPQAVRELGTETLEAVEGTSQDKPAERDALAKIPVPARKASPKW